MLIWDDSLLVSSCIVVKSRIDLLNTVSGIVCPWTITSLKSFSPVWVLQQTHKRQWLHIVLPQNFHQSPSSITWYFWVLQILISDQKITVWPLLTFEDIYIYICIYCFEHHLKKIESRTLWVDPYCPFRKFINFYKKKGIYGIWFDAVLFSIYLANSDQ